MSKFETVYLNSKDRDTTSTSTTDFQYTMKDSISVATNGLNQVKLTQAIIPYSWYYIKVAINDQITFTDPGAQIAILDPGTYTHDELAAEAQTQMNAVSATTWTVVYNSITDEFEFTSAIATVITWSTSLAFDAYGFAATDTGSATIHRSTQSPVIEDSNVFLKINFEEQSEEILQTKATRHTFTFPVVSDYTKNLVYKPDTPMVIQKFNKNAVIKKIGIQVTASSQETIPLDLRARDIEVELRFENSKNL